ncbi:MAG: Carboxyl-terminal protease [Microgenomates bacterium 39_7]|nr:MAG: Carboxyl-terminal protease [Microgenomates bacterium 39_7]
MTNYQQETIQQESVMARKKIAFSTLRNIIVGLLLFMLGVVLGQRYRGRIPIVSSELIPSNSSTPLGKLVGQLVPPENKDIDFDVFWEVWSLLENEYLDADQLDSQEMVDGAIRGMVQAAGDPYTIYLSPQDNKRSGEDLQGTFFGVGIELGYIDGVLAIIAPLEGTPAQEAGLQAGDLILQVKDPQKGIDEDSSGWSLIEAVEKIRGPKGSMVTFTIYREGADAPFEVSVRRDEILVDTVNLDLIEHEGKTIAHLRVTRFGGRTKEEWDVAVAKILAANPRVEGIVLDFRNNPGGYFDRSIDLASDFIQNDVVVTQKGKVFTQDYRTNGSARLRNYPLVVLVNKGSASASEIVAGALRDDLGIKLIGEQTFGKGTVQDRKEISNGGGMHITVGRWMLPKGDWIHDEGIPVDIEVEQDFDTEEDEVLLRGLEELARN